MIWHAVIFLILVIVSCFLLIKKYDNWSDPLLIGLLVLFVIAGTIQVTKIFTEQQYTEVHVKIQSKDNRYWEEAIYYKGEDNVLYVREDNVREAFLNPFYSPTYKKAEKEKEESGEDMMESKFFKKGELKDKEIVAALEQAAKDYENGAIAEVRDVLAEIVDAIDEFEAEFNGT